MDQSETPPASRSAPIRVLVAHSQKLVAETLAVSLDRDPKLIVVATTPTMGLDAVDIALETHPDVMLVDHWLPVIGGPMVARMVLARSPRVRILMMSWLQSPTNVAEAIQAGAVAYLPMSVGLDEVYVAIRRAHAGEKAVFDEKFMAMVADLARREAESKKRSELVKALTPRDVRTLWLVSSGRQMKEIAETLSVTPGSLQMKLHRIYTKIGARSQMEAIAMAREHDLIPADFTRYPDGP